MSILSLAFNSDATLLSCGTEGGFIIYKLAPNLQKHIFTNLDGGVGMMKVLNRSNISLLVGGGDNPFEEESTVVLWNAETKKSVMAIGFREKIRNVFVSVQQKIIVVLEKKICVFNFQGIDVGSNDTFSNPTGVCDMVEPNETSIIATLGLKKGEIALWNLKTNAYKTIEAHNNSIDAIALSRDGSLVATASESGTNIHVYSTGNSDLLYKFKRGTFTARIHDLAISDDLKYLACCSENGTAHFFELTNKTDSKNTKSALATVSSILPDTLGAKYFDSVWAFQSVDLNNTSRMMCTFDTNNALHIATHDGDYFRIRGKEFTDMKRSKLQTNNA